MLRPGDRGGVKRVDKADGGSVLFCYQLYILERVIRRPYRLFPLLGIVLMSSLYPENG